MSLEAVLRRAALQGHLDDARPCAIFFDLSGFEERVAALQRALPGVSHTLAVKALPLPRLLRIAAGLDLGLEVASPGELELARSIGIDPARVVYDSPAKTRRDIRAALDWGCRLNVDNFQELERVAESPPARGVGLRLNPGVTGVRIPGSFTGGAGSKFGISLAEHREELRRAFRRFPWLDGVHLHIGSQGCPLETLVEGVRRVAAFTVELLDAGVGVRCLDIGGGLPVAYRDGDGAVSFDEYAAALRAAVPELFRPELTLLTEFGRALLAPCGWVASRVEYTRPGATENTAVIHVGADLFVRTAYRPEEWHHEVEVYDSAGAPKGPPLSPWSIAGPLCFAADYVAVGRELPRIEPGDLVVIRDAGAYTLSMWSRYNSRLVPAVFGYRAGSEELVVLKPAEELGDLLRFWGSE